MALLSSARMSRRTKLSLAVALPIALLGVVAAAGLGAIRLPGDTPRAAGPPPLDRAREASPSRYDLALRQGARIARTPDRRSFYVFWPGTRRGGKVIVSLHGYVVNALDDFSYWRDYAARRGYGLLALQWRLGPSSRESYQVGEIYGQATRILRARGVAPGQALLHGYSSSATRTYAIAALDRRSARYFSLFIANSGGASRTTAGYGQVFGGPASRRPLTATNWVLWCGGLDREFATGCPLVRRTAGLIRRRGGRVAHLLAVPGARHGGFFRTPASVDTALSEFARLSSR